MSVFYFQLKNKVTARLEQRAETHTICIHLTFYPSVFLSFHILTFHILFCLSNIIILVLLPGHFTRVHEKKKKNIKILPLWMLNITIALFLTEMVLDILSYTLLLALSNLPKNVQGTKDNNTN